MHKLPVLNPKQIIKLLEKYGFLLDHVSGSHYIYYHPKSNKRVTVPFHKKDLPRGTLISIFKQSGIEKSNFF